MIQPASPGLSSSRAGILGLGILALILLAAITWALGASSDAARETACERAGGHSYSTGRVVLCLDSEGRVIER
jgi:hypothetical protein